jgi:hypothetical protein
MVQWLRGLPDILANCAGRARGCEIRRRDIAVDGPQRILVFMIFLAFLSAAFVTSLRAARIWNPYFQGGRCWIKQMRAAWRIDRLSLGEIASRGRPPSSTLQRP